MNYKVTVIIPTYNAEKSINHTIKTLKNQTLGFNNIELIIVDDNSKDKTKKILEEYREKYDNIKLIFLDKNSGSAGNGRNIGIKHASSDYIMFLDQDDGYTTSMCEILFNTIKKYETDIVICEHKTIMNNNFQKYISECDLSYIECDPKKNKTIFNNIYMWNKIFKKEFIINNNIKCPNSLSEDMVFCINAYLNTEKIIFLYKYQGYLYNVRDSKKDSSTINSINYMQYLSILNGFYETINLLKKHERDDLINCIMKNHFTTLISLFIKLNTNNKSKIIILEKLYEFIEYSNLTQPLTENWAEIIKRNIKKRNFKKIIYLTKIIKKFYASNTLRKIYRKIYGKY